MIAYREIPHIKQQVVYVKAGHARLIVQQQA
jgi:hypothetical protein